ncbi:MAG: DUF4810 domain-containing protein [Succinivibrio sp.]
MKKTILSLFVSSLVVLTGCSSSKVPLVYCHDDSYTKSMYYYLQDEPNYDEQLELMQDYFAAASQTNTQPAPGAYAHMAMVYSKIGNDAEAIKYLNMEKEMYPESAHYIDFLLNRKKEQK